MRLFLQLVDELRDFETHLKYGVVNVDKPSGLTSHQTTQEVKSILKAEKAGHSGTLDLHVTGVLPIFLNESTKMVKVVLESPKEYIGLARFHKKITEKELKRTIKKFTGEIDQMPPVKSRVKRVLRKRTVYSIEMLEFRGKLLKFRVSCEAGTYIRKLIHDMGEFLEVGAQMTELRRIKAGPFTEKKNLITLEKLRNATKKELMKIILPVEFAVSELNKIYVDNKAAKTITQGASLKVPGVEKIEGDIEKSDLIALFTLKNELIAIASAKMTSKAMKSKKRGVAATLERVIMPICSV